MEKTEIPDLTEFVEEYLPSKLPLNWHHKLFYDLLTSKIIQKPDGKLYFNKGDKINQDILLLAPRFHAKSQCISINYALWQIYKNPNIRIMIVSANEEIAISFNRAIMNNLENNHKLIEKFGYMVPQFQDKKKWGEKALIIKRDSMEKDPTVVGLGVGGKLISRRADIVIIDDLVDLESARTKSARLKVKEWFDNVLVPILEDNGKIIVAGTSWYDGDIYDLLWQESEFDIRLKLKALMYDGKYERTDGKEVRYIPYKLLEYPKAQKAQDIFSDEIIHHYRLYTKLKGGVMWPEKWSFENLMRKKRKSNMSMASFNRQYLNEPMSEEEQVFKDTDIKRAILSGTNKYLVPDWDNSNPDRYLGYGHMIIAVGVDLAISKKKKSDKSAIAVWGLTDKRMRVPLYLEQGRWSPDETIQKVNEIYDRYHPVKIKVENIAFQDMLLQSLQKDDIPVEGFATTSTKKFNEETGLAHVASLIEQDKLLLPSSRKNNEYYNRVRELIGQMSVYTYDQHAGDMLMASWFALDVLRDFDKKLRDNRGYFSTVALVEQMKKVRASSRVFLLGYKPPVFRIAYNSLLYIFRPVAVGTPFIQTDEPFMIFITRHHRSIAYIIQKQTNEIVGKIEGDISVLLFASLIEKAGYFFNNALLVIDRNGEGDALLLEMSKRDYRNVLVTQPDKEGLPVIDEGYTISGQNLPLAVDYFKNMVDGLHIDIPDEQLVKEMGELIAVEGDKLTMSFGEGQRIKTMASALWLLDNYENTEKIQLTIKKRRPTQPMQPRYRVFRRK